MVVFIKDLDVPYKPRLGLGELVQVELPDVMSEELLGPSDITLDLERYVVKPVHFPRTMSVQHHLQAHGHFQQRESCP